MNGFQSDGKREGTFEDGRAVQWEMEQDRKRGVRKGTDCVLVQMALDFSRTQSFRKTSETEYYLKRKRARDGERSVFCSTAGHHVFFPIVLTYFMDLNVMNEQVNERIGNDSVMNEKKGNEQ